KFNVSAKGTFGNSSEWIRSNRETSLQYASGGRNTLAWTFDAAGGRKLVWCCVCSLTMVHISETNFRNQV
ncbi:MAG: hypothetical protein ACTS7C_00505, partial [Candidatus Hodgkinia cicadicola]